MQPLTSKDEFVILATDGLWDFYSNEEVLQLIGNYKMNENPSNLLIVDVLKKAIENSGSRPTVESFQNMVSLPHEVRRKYYDDITVFIIKIKV